MPSARSGAARQLEGNSLCSMGVLEFLGCGCICSDHRSCCVHSLLLKSQPRIPARLHSSWPWVPHPFFQLSALASGLGISAVSGISASAPSKLGRKCSSKHCPQGAPRGWRSASFPQAQNSAPPDGTLEQPKQLLPPSHLREELTSFTDCRVEVPLQALIRLSKYPVLALWP